MSSIDQQFIEYVIKSLVSKPDVVKVDRRIDEKGVLLELTVDPEDLGRVIGKRGATAQSLRTLLRALGTKNDARYNLKIIDNGAPRPAPAASDDSTARTDDSMPPPSESSGEETAAPIDNIPTPEESPDEPSSVVTKTRRELEEFDDLDV